MTVVESTYPGSFATLLTHLGGLLSSIGTFLGSFCSPLGCSGPYLAPPGTLCDHPAPLWSPFGFLLGPIGLPLAPTCPPFYPPFGILLAPFGSPCLGFLIPGLSKLFNPRRIHVPGLFEISPGVSGSLLAHQRANQHTKKRSTSKQGRQTTQNQQASKHMHINA